MGLTSGAQEATSRGRHEKVVVFKNCFTVDEMNSAPELILTVRDGLRNVCAPFGITKKINVFDGHPMGVCSVAFVNHEEADRAIQNLHARMFRGRVRNLTLIQGVCQIKNKNFVSQIFLLGIFVVTERTFFISKLVELFSWLFCQQITTEI